MTVKHIVFDWDGTIAATHEQICKAYNHTSDCLDMPRLSSDEVSYICRSLPNREAFQYAWREKAALAAPICLEFYGKHHLDGLQLMPQVMEVLEFCKNSGVMCHICTNKPRQFLLLEMDKLGLQNYFQNIVAAGDFPKGKPDCATCLGVFPDGLPDSAEILVVGDGEADVKMAKCYNAAAIIYSPQQDYRGIAPQYQIQNFSEIIPIIEKLKS